MALVDEIEADLYAAEIVEDLFESVEWVDGANTYYVKAIIEPAAFEEEFESLGGSQLRDSKVFTFRRKELLQQQSDVTMLGTHVVYNSRKYDINEFPNGERVNHPKITVLGVLRDNT